MLINWAKQQPRRVMAKMRTFTFYDGDEVKTVESLSFKKAVKSFQTSAKSKNVAVIN